MAAKTTASSRKISGSCASTISDADVIRKILTDDSDVFLRSLADRTNSVYEKIIKFITSPESEVTLMIQLLQNLEQYTSLLNEDHKVLVGAIVHMNWLNRGPELASSYQAFLLNLVSGHASYLKPCLRMLVKKFIPEAAMLASLDDRTVKADIDVNFSNVHNLLKSISQIVPLTSVLLPQIMEDSFPYINKSGAIFESYTRSLLTVTSYLPALRHTILELLVKHMLKLDVRSSRVDISTAIFTGDDEEGENDKDDEEAMFEMEDAKDEKLVPIPEKLEDRLAATLPQAGALDDMMTLTSQYIRETCYKKDKLDWEATKQLYRELLSIFDKFIFPTHESCHVQFLMFFICSFKEALSDGYIDYLWKRVTDPTAQAVYRQTAACYIGSFMARAKFISTHTTKQLLELIMKWVHSYLDQTCDQRLSADVSHHGPFYSVCQTAFYIFCFKHNDLIQSKKDHKWAESLNFQRVITSKLNPLRVCLPIIVKTFASASRMHQLAFCDTIIERNNRYTIPVAMENRTHLESYFPFDPYLLPRSGSHMTPLYKEFHGSLPEVADLESEEEDDFLPDEDEDHYHNRDAENLAMSLGRNPVDFLHYGVSPGFKHG